LNSRKGVFFITMNQSIPNMKNILRLSALCLTLALYSCSDKDTVSFTEPQPAEMKNLSAIPNKYHGVYSSSSDSTKVTIDKQLVLRTYTGQMTIHQDDLSEYEYISNGYLYDRSTGSKAPVKIAGDSLRVDVSYSDTLFDIHKHIARKSVGSIFLNKEIKQGNWAVRKVTLNGKSLSIGKLAASEADNLPFEKVAEDSLNLAQYKAKKKQFKTYIRNGGFKDQEVYERIY
jgi:hypothetical protein